MAFIETIKEAAGAAVEVIKENPVAAGVVAGVVAAGVGGTIWWRRRKAKKVDVKVRAHLEQVAAAGNPALAAAHAAAAEKATA